MTRTRRRAAAVLVVATAAYAVPWSLPAAAAPAGEDHRPCVSRVEYLSSLHGRPAGSAPHAPTFTRHELEVRWDVVGLGVHEPIPGVSPAHSMTIEYPRCGFRTIALGWYGAVYARGTHRVEILADYRASGAHPTAPE